MRRKKKPSYKLVFKVEHTVVVAASDERHAMDAALAWVKDRPDGQIVKEYRIEGGR